ncbi:MAG TPA: dihydroorotase [Phycisphaerales bacterium]|nr:dihydroorotase [Phycisphaerales bacterium]
MSTLLITSGRVIDPASGVDREADVAIADGLVAAVGEGLARSGADRVIDAGGCIVAPGLIDPHVHLREPGMEQAETIRSGAAASAAGGFTTVCCMPNTTPALDDAALVEFVYTRAERAGPGARVFPVGAVSKGRRGEELAEIMLMAQAGAVGFTDDGDCVASPGLMARALAYIKPTGLALMQHCQEVTLTRGASMHAGAVATRLGLGGWPRVAEELIIERDVRLNRGIGCRYHVQHLSSGGSVEIVRAARAAGQPVSAEVSPHHLLLTHEEVDRHGGYWTSAKMNPPLRERSDIGAILEGVADGTITVLATDHAPHTADRKALDFESAPFGIVGIETALALYIKALIEPGVIDWPRMISMMTIEPARLCGLDSLEAGGTRRGGLGLGRLHVGGAADVTVIDPNLEWTIDAGAFVSLSRNTPFDGWRVRGRAVATVVGGEVVHTVSSQESDHAHSHRS